MCACASILSDLWVSFGDNPDPVTNPVLGAFRAGWPRFCRWLIALDLRGCAQEMLRRAKARGVA